MKINLLFVLLLCIVFSSCDQKREREKGVLYSVQKNSKWGYEDYNSNVAIDYKYDNAGPFSNGAAMVLLNEKFLIIDEKGKSLSKQYEDMRRKGNYFLAGEYGLMDLLDLNGRVVEDSLNDAGFYNKDSTHLLLEKNFDGTRRFNFIDANKKLALPMWIDSHPDFAFQDSDFPMDDIVPKRREKLILISFQKNNRTRYAYMSDKMNIVTDTSFDNGVSMEGGYGFLFKRTTDMHQDEFYIFDSTGNNVCKLKAYKIIDIIPKYNLITADAKSGECVYDLRTGKKISGPFNQIGEGSSSGGWGFSLSAKTIIKASYSAADYRGFSEGLIKFYDSPLKGGYLDSTGKVSIPAKYETVNNFNEGMARVAKYNRAKRRTEVGFINRKGELVIPYLYNGAEDFVKGVAVVTLDGKKIKIDKTGKEKK